MMSRAFKTLLAVLCMAVTAACGGVRDGMTGNPTVELEQQVRLMLTYDENSDGVVTRDELEEGLHRQFAGIDVGHRGYLDAKEARAEDGLRSRVLGASYSPMVDARRNGMIDFDEFAALPRSIFDRLDRNHDGKLDQNELRLIQSVRGPVAPASARGRGQ
jgi:Ca2+-binding EF-hand superfamily protein